jgi:hypothetical protein
VVTRPVYAARPDRRRRPQPGDGGVGGDRRLLPQFYTSADSFGPTVVFAHDKASSAVINVRDNTISYLDLAAAPLAAPTSGSGSRGRSAGRRTTPSASRSTSRGARSSLSA